MKEQKHYYKIVRCLASPLRKGIGMYSMYAQGGLQKRYFKGVWNFAKLKYILKGYGFLVFTDKEAALQTAMNSVMTYILEVWEVQILGKIELPKCRLEIGSIDGSAVTEENLQKLVKGGLAKFGYDVDFRHGWPSSTAMCMGVKLVQEVGVGA